MDPITTAIVTTVATGLTKDAAKAGYEKLKNLIFGAAPEKQPELEAAIAAIENAKADLERLLAGSGAAQRADVLAQAAELMKQSGIHVVGDDNIVLTGGSKGGKFGDIHGDFTIN